MAEDPDVGRRRFLKQSVLSFAQTAAEFVKHRDAPKESREAPIQHRMDWLRPPGAVEEELFLDRCTRCGDCVDACPVECIGLSPRDKTPEIFPDQVPCSLCEDFPCVAACETEALLPVSGRQHVQMGLAVVSHRFCTAAQGCNACVSQCPMRALEMDFGSLRLKVDERACVGCGICQQVCKTVNDRIAIKVTSTRWERS